MSQQWNHIYRMQTRRIGRNRAFNSLALVAALIVLVGAPTESRAEQLKPEIAAAFAKYAQSKETRSNAGPADGKTFLWIDALPEKGRAEAYAPL